MKLRGRPPWNFRPGENTLSDNPSDTPAEKPKIIIDEDWKSRVQAEKEALDRQKAAQQPTTSTESSRPAPQPTPPSDAPRGELPPATLPVLLTTLATQALVALGQIANPGADTAEVRLDEAKHFIDMLEMLERKTAGNRSPDESRLLDNLLHELRLTFVAVAKR
jgi:hypothetical protein